MKVKIQANGDHSTTCLGDWYAMDIILDRKQFVICVSSRSRLAVVLVAAPYASIPNRICDAVAELLTAIGISESSVQLERDKMNQVVLAKTMSKSILGTLNEYRHQLEALMQSDRVGKDEALKMSLYLSEIISLALPEVYPRRAAFKLFGQELPNSRISQFQV
jgi:hypothetical protein